MSKPRPTSALELGQHLEQFQIQGNHLENVQQTAKQIETLVFKKDSRLCNDERRHVVIPPLLRMLGFRTGRFNLQRHVSETDATISSSPTGVYLIPVRTEGHPTVSGKELRVGLCTYITQNVNIGPEVDLIVVRKADAEGVQQKADAKGVQQKAGAKGVQQEADAEGVQQKADAKGAQQKADAESVPQEA